jgi:uncharacterized membrane protein (DUF2068 family)
MDSRPIDARLMDARRGGLAGPGHSILPWIVAFKATKSTLLTVLGVGLLFSLRRDPVDLVWQITNAVHLPVTSRLFERVLNLAFNATPRKEIVLAMTAFGYAILMGTEGVGLYLRRPWARWFTIGATGSLIPVEVYEILREPHPVRVVVLVLNIAVVMYLVRRKEAFE